MRQFTSIYNAWIYALMVFSEMQVLKLHCSKAENQSRTSKKTKQKTKNIWDCMKWASRRIQYESWDVRACVASLCASASPGCWSCGLNWNEDMSDDSLRSDAGGRQHPCSLHLSAQALWQEVSGNLINRNGCRLFNLPVPTKHDCCVSAEIYRKPPVKSADTRPRELLRE